MVLVFQLLDFLFIPPVRRQRQKLNLQLLSQQLPPHERDSFGIAVPNSDIADCTWRTWL